MKNREAIIEEFKNAPEGTLVMTGKLYREKYSTKMSEAAFAQAISRLCRSGEIVRISKGVYCRPKKTRFGTILPSEKEIVDLFTTGTNGVLVGYGLYNALGVTTQISKRQTAYSSVADERLKQIGSVTVRKYDLEYTPEVKSIIRMMELLHHYKEIQDLNGAEMIRSTRVLAGEYNEDAFEIVSGEYTIAIKDGKLLTCNLDVELRYTPTDGDYSDRIVTLKNSVGIKINEKLDKASEYVAPNQVNTRLLSLGLNNSKYYIL